LRHVPKAALERISAPGVHPFVFPRRGIVPGLLVGVGQVFGVGDEFLSSVEVEFVIFEAGGALHQAAASGGHDHEEQGEQGREGPEFEGREGAVHVPWFKVRHSVVLREFSRH
jgi:hypothetical protein